MIALVLALLPGLAHAVSKKPFGDLVALDDQRLDQLRGGLDAGTGLVVNFGFTREISINGEVVARQLLVINDLGALLNGTLPSLQVISNLGQIVQNGPGNVVGSSAASDARAQALEGAQAATAANVAAAAAGPPAVPAAAPATTAPATSVPTQVASAPNPPAATSGAGANTAAVPAATPSAAPAPPAAAPANAATASTPVSASAAPAPASTAAPAAAAPAPAAAPASSTQAITIQLPNGTLTLNLPNTNAITQNTETIVQNSMHNATIQINTALSAALNSASLARALTLAGQVRAP
jgi:hypothetical protein